MTRLILENLSKTYPGGVRALEDFSLEIAEGELVAIVGPSGCGKSTLLRLIAGLEEETSGTVRLGGRVLNGLPPKDRDIAIVFQSYTLMPHLNVLENLCFGLKIRGEPRAEREAKARETASLLGIGALLQRYPAEISGGERQRVALGRAILRRPRAFLFDEPLSSLDAQMRLQLRVEIQRLHQRLRTPMLFVTHDQSEALSLADRVLVLHQGRIQQTASPKELYLRPANTFVASFIGSPGMNLFPGRVETREGFPHFVSPALAFPLTPEQRVLLGDMEEVIAGIRPEQLRPPQTGDVPLLQGQVTAAETQGGQTCYYLQMGETAFAARPPKPATGIPGDTLLWTFPPEGAVFFSAKNQSLVHP